MLNGIMLLLLLGAILPLMLQQRGTHGFHTVQRSNGVVQAFKPPSYDTTTHPPKDLQKTGKAFAENTMAKRNSSFLLSILSHFPASKTPNKTRLAILRRLVEAKNISCAFIYLKTIHANGTEYYDPEVRLEDVRIEVVNQHGGEYNGSSASGPSVDTYDQQGAMYFAVAVITIYGLSIALLIASSMRRSDEDYELKGFIRSFAQLDGSRPKKPREKFKIQKALLESGILIRLTAQGLPRKVLPTLFECSPSSSTAPLPVVSSRGEDCLEAGPNETPSSTYGDKAHSMDTNQSSDRDMSNPTTSDTSSADMVEPGKDSTKELAHSSTVVSGSNTPQEEARSCSIGSARAAESDNIDSVEDTSGQPEMKDVWSVPTIPKAHSAAPGGPRRVKIYQGRENGKIDVRSVDVAVDIPEDSII